MLHDWRLYAGVEAALCQYAMENARGQLAPSGHGRSAAALARRYARALRAFRYFDERDYCETEAPDDITNTDASE